MKYRVDSILGDFIVKSHDYQRYKNTYAAAIVKDGDGKILLLKRASQDSFHPNTWCLPSGHIEEGEDYKTTAIRELKEETCLECANENGYEVNLVKKVEISESDTCIYYCEVYVNFDGHDIVLDKEHEQYDFLSLKDIKERDDLILDLKQHLICIFDDPVELSLQEIKKGFYDGDISSSDMQYLLSSYNDYQNQKIGDKLLYDKVLYEKTVAGWIDIHHL